jgi:hypothetical protein
VSKVSTLVASTRGDAVLISESTEKGLRMRKVFLLTALVLPLAANAQEKKQPDVRVEYEKKTVINFDDDTIQGDLTRPDGEYVEARKRVNHSNLIKIREDWREKVKQAAADL